MKPSIVYMTFQLFVLAAFFGATPVTAKQTALEAGTSAYMIAGGKGHEEKQIEVFYHKPKNFTENSRVLMVLPGAGRNADSYLEGWVKASEKYGVLVISLGYSKKHYPQFWHYNIGRMVTDVTFNEARDQIKGYRVVKDSSQWILTDFDRVFDDVTAKLNMKTSRYDMFGHSAGGQILHRLTLFGNTEKVDRLLSSNSGWYTVPVFDKPFPFGLKNGVITPAKVNKAFQAKLVLFIGELDNEHETRGHLATGPGIDMQGNSRVARADYFFKQSKSTASKLNAQFNWQKVIVPGVGHNRKKMSIAAAEYLYR